MSKFLGIWVLAGGIGLAQTSNPTAGSLQAAEAGRRTYRVHCSSCHGPKAQGGRAPDLTRGSSRAADPDAELFRTVSEGIPGSDMAPYRERLQSDDIWRIVAFLRSVGRQDSPIPGDPALGESLFWGKGGCGNCHAIGARGNRIGPDLTRIGRQRSVAYLKESLVSPSADIGTEFNSVTVVTRDGKTVRGIAKALDDFSVVSIDFTGRISSFERGDVRSVSRDAVSLMPEYGKILTETELTGVVAYLAGLGRN